MGDSWADTQISMISSAGRESEEVIIRNNAAKTFRGGSAKDYVFGLNLSLFWSRIKADYVHKKPGTYTRIMGLGK